jgi:hypothetical protein
MSANLLLSRLHGLRQHGSAWRADCPNGHNKARRSLSVTEVDDGRVMLHCFACNDTPGILRALGLEMADLFPEPIKDTSPEARKAAAEAFKRNAWRAALGVLNREATLVLIAANDMQAGNVLPETDVVRVRLAAQRIAQAREVLR